MFPAARPGVHHAPRWPLFHGALALVLAWGALAFGANYPWAFWPLAAAAGVCGVIGLLLPSSSPRLPGSAMVLWLAAIAVTMLLQIVPVPIDLLAAMSPNLRQILGELDLTVAAGAVRTHAISIAPAATLTAIGLYTAFVVMMLGVSRALAVTGARWLAGSVAGLGGALALIGIIQQPLYKGKIYGVWTPLMGGVPFGPFVNKNHFAGWMLMALPLTLGLLCAVVMRAMQRVQPDWRHRLLWLSTPDASRALLLAAAASVMALSLGFTMSRSGMLALAVTLSVAGSCLVRRLPTTSTRLAAGFYLVALTLLVVAWGGADAIAARFSTADPNTVSDRLPIWRDTLPIVRDFWLTGTGLNTYGVATLVYHTSLPGLHLREAHNDYLQLAAEGGLLVGIPIAGALVMFALQVRRRFRASSGSSYWIRAGAVMGIIAIAVQTLVEFSLQMPGNAVLFAMLCAIALHRDPRAHVRPDRVPA
jgi:O-antigen ligase